MQTIPKFDKPVEEQMTSVFLSYSSFDHFFAELADIKLREEGISLWRDQGKLRAGADWRNGIERGISESTAVLVALSSNSTASSYVTYEWAYAIGKGKPIIPLKLNECSFHPRLEAVQYLDFSVPSALPWMSLFEQINEIETEFQRSAARETFSVAEHSSNESDPMVTAILEYLDQRGYQMASFERLRKRIDENMTDDRFEALIKKNSDIFRKSKLADGRLALAKKIP